MANTQNKKSGSSAASKTKSTQTKKSSQAKKPAQKNINKKEVPVTVKRQKYAIILTAAAVFLACLIFIEGESFWLSMHNAIFGIFGFCTYTLPVLLVYMAFVYAKDKPLGSIASNLTGIGVLVALLSGAIHNFANTAEYLRDISLVEQIPDCWEKGSEFGNGGVIGAVIGGLVAKALGKTGAGITIVILIFVIAMLLTGTTLLEFISALKKPVERVGELTTEKLEQSAQRREQRELEREENGEEKPAKKAFNPPKKPTVAVERFEDNFVNDETTFEPVAEPVSEPAIPDIPIVNLPDSEPSDVVEETIEEAVKENKKRRKRPANPDDIPEEPVAEDIPVEIIEDEKPAYVFPPVECLKLAEKEAATDNMTEMQMGAKKLLATLESFKIKAEVTNICRGPSVTRYELVPDAGVRINKITNLSDDIALRLAATSVRIEAPIPGKSAIGIEVPNSAKSMVTMREIIDTPQFRDAKSKLTVALGKDITGNIICADLAKMPHLLVAGTTGSGKSVCLNSMIVSILYNATPDEVKLVMIDPKMVEFTIYNGIAHLEVPVVSNPRKAAGALGWAVGEMEKRYQLFSENSVRDIKGFNLLCESRADLQKMSQIVIFIDEL
ncbi:MAG: DNA translocase FtsK 4TM domain-containing protein, partial [Clostridia bacterium]|nr:DNA translocase FtsK 4TM domain-containing protein [Clostridia bacterium]